MNKLEESENLYFNVYYLEILLCVSGLGYVLIEYRSCRSYDKFVLKNVMLHEMIVLP